MERTQAKNLVAALDIGSSKVAVALAEITSDSTFKVIGVGKVASHGISKGSVQDVEKLVEAIRDAVREASITAGDIPITHVVAALTGKKLHCINKVSQMVLPEGEVRAEDVKKATRLALEFTPEEQAGVDKELQSEDDHVVMHTIKGYTAGNDDIIVNNPIGMAGPLLRAHAHLAIGSDSITVNLVKCIRKAGLDLDGLIMQPWASAESCLTETEKANGVIVLDMGADCTDIVCYSNKHIEYTAMVPFGGSCFTRDLSVGLGCSLADAEEIKLMYGGVAPSADDHYVQVHYTNEATQTDCTVSVSQIVSIMQPRAVEVLDVIRHHLNKDYWLSRAASGIVVTGGMANTAKLPELINHVWGLPVRRGIPKAMHDSVVDLAHPEDATLMGVLYEILRRRALMENKPTISNNGLWSWVKGAVFGGFAD